MTADAGGAVGATARPVPLDDDVLRFLRAGRSSAEVLARNGVALLFRHRLRDELIDAESAALRDAATPFARRTVEAEELRLRASQILDEHGIRHVILKGSVLGQRWQQRHGVDARTWSDVDLLVTPANAEPASSALVTALSMRVTARSHGELTLTDPRGTPIDLHWLPINNGPLCARFRLDAGDVIDSDGPTMLLLHTALHATISDLGRLAAIVDVDAAATAPELDWADVQRHAQDHRLQLVLAVALQRARRWMSTPVPDDLVDVRDGWARVTRRGADRPPASYLAGRWSGAALARHTRETTARSARSLLAATPTIARTQWSLAVRRGTAGSR